ncbi:MAG: hypothetical protein ABIJ27_05460 [Candidatus Omnitrophota bacterium]
MTDVRKKITTVLRFVIARSFATEGGGRQSNLSQNILKARLLRSRCSLAMTNRVVALATEDEMSEGVLSPPGSANDKPDALFSEI